MYQSVKPSLPSSIADRFRARTPRSGLLAASARTVFPSGVTHDSRFLKPYGIYVERASGARKWDVDGNEYIDYFGGHGALLLGHNHPEVLAATEAALKRGTHFAAGHETEIEWAKLVQRMVPCAERVRFTSSGTEAVFMAIRLARAATGRSRVLRFKGHFHGWQDEVVAGYQSHFDASPPSGVVPEVAGRSVLIEAGDPGAVAAVLEQRDGDIAAVIVEPLGAGTGMVPIRPDFLRSLRDQTTEHGVVLIFDEVITGFRVSPGGVQAKHGITPDLTTLAKIVAGGLPGGAVVGRAPLFDRLDFDKSEAAGAEKIYHPGTFNANPVSAAAGRATLEVIGSTDACERADRLAACLRGALRRVLVVEGVPWGVYGESSAVHIFMNPRQRALSPDGFDPHAYHREELRDRPKEVLTSLRLAMLSEGVDLAGWPGGVLSIAHTEVLIERTAEAFRASLRALRRERILA